MWTPSFFAYRVSGITCHSECATPWKVGPAAKRAARYRRGDLEDAARELPNLPLEGACAR
jgi:hypothetical protein